MNIDNWVTLGEAAQLVITVVMAARAGVLGGGMTKPLPRITGAGCTINNRRPLVFAREEAKSG